MPSVEERVGRRTARREDDSLVEQRLGPGSERIEKAGHAEQRGLSVAMFERPEQATSAHGSNCQIQPRMRHGSRTICIRKRCSQYRTIGVADGCGAIRAREPLRAVRREQPIVREERFARS